MGWFAGPVMMVAVIAVVVAVVVLIIRWLGGPGHGSMHPPAPPATAPLDILKERYARGEIDKEEYEERRRVLES
jgi:putative membrane protein